MSIATLCSTLLSLDTAAQAQLNGTSPWTVISPRWGPEPDTGRGTVDIIWSCLVTIFACSWTVTHPLMRHNAHWSFSKAWFCIVAVIAPEMLVMLAAVDYLIARYFLTPMKRTTNGQWGMSQQFFISMGGVELEFQDCTEILGYDDGILNPVKALEVFQCALQLNLLSNRSLSKEDIKKRAKANYIVKALVCLQASWLVAQVIGRAVTRFPITTLEVATVGYVVCALISYTFWWHKPQDAETQITINCETFTRTEFYERIFAAKPLHKPVKWWKRRLLCLLSGIFGAVHCTAWNFYFPTSAECIVWRTTSVLTVILPIVFFYGRFVDALQPLNPAAKRIALSYIPVRLYLLIEPLLAFRSVPVGIFYIVSWSTWIPRV